MQKQCHISGKINQKISGFIQGYISAEQVSITHVEALPRQCLHVIVCGKTRIDWNQQHDISGLGHLEFHLCLDRYW